MDTSHRHTETGTLVEISETRVFSAFFKKREFKIRYSDTDFNGKIVTRVVKLAAVNDECDMLNELRIDDLIEVRFYLDGKDYEKDGKKMHFTSLIAYDMLKISGGSNGTEEERNSVIDKNGLIAQQKEATVEELIRSGAFVTAEDDPFSSAPSKSPEVKKDDEFGDLPF